MTVLEKRGLFGGPRGNLGFNLTNLVLSTCTQLAYLTSWNGKPVGLALGLALPPAIAVFPQRATTDPKKLEDRFQEYDGPVYFNKGL
jgi:hypothetical protein